MKRFKNPTGLIVSAVCIIFVAVSFYGIVACNTYQLNGILKDLSNATFSIFFSVLLVNILIENAFEKEKKRHEELRLKKEKKEWDFIYQYLFELILDNAIAALNVMPGLYRALSDTDLDNFPNVLQKHLIDEAFTKQKEEKDNYITSLNRFIHRCNPDQVKTYRSLENAFRDIKRPGEFIWDIRNADKNHFMLKSGAIRETYDAVHRSISLTQFYILQVLGDLEFTRFKENIKYPDLSEYELGSSTHVIGLGLLRPDLYFSDLEKLGFAFTDKIIQFFLCVKYDDEYQNYFYNS